MGDAEVVQALNDFKSSVVKELAVHGERIKAIREHMAQSNGAIESLVRRQGDHDTRIALMEAVETTILKQWTGQQEECKTHIDRTAKLEQRLTLVFLVSPIFSLAGGALVKFMEIKGLF